MSMSVAFVLAMQTAAAGPPIGVAAWSQDGALCLAMAAPALAPGTAVTLIQPVAQQSVLVATISGSAPSCEIMRMPPDIEPKSASLRRSVG
jgi:hypothetical protein